MAKNDAMREAQWLSDLSLRNSQCNGDGGIEATIMRLSNHPELLHHLLNVNPDPVRMSAVSPTNFNFLLSSTCGCATSIGGDRQLSKALVYSHTSPNDDRATSLEPLTFLPTNEDARMAIDAQILSEESSDTNAPPRKPRLVLLSLFVALALAVMLMGLFSLA